jgi:hypothetical protein
MKNFTKNLKRLKDKKESLEFQMNLQGSLISHNYVVVVGACTVGTNDEGKAILKPSDKLPTQWTADGVKEIKEKCSFTNMHGEKMDIKAVPYKEWYSKELEGVNDALDMLNKQFDKEIDYLLDKIEEKGII